MPSIDATIRATRRPFTPPRVSGLVQLDADDLAGTPPAEGGSVAEASARFDAIQAECNRDGLRYHALDLTAIDPNTHTKAQMHAAAMEYAAAFADIQSSLGLCYEHAEVGKAALGKVPEPGTPPPEVPTGLAAVIGTYPGHGRAVDAYAGRTEDEVAWGSHTGLPLVAPSDGRVEVYQFGTPLATVQAMGEVYAANYRALFADWVCLASPQQTMFVCVFWPDGVLSIEGQRIGHLHYGHVRRDIKAGAVRQGEVMAYVHDSGIRFEPGVPQARAGHTHCCAGAGAALSPNGDLPGRLAAVAQGWAVTDVGFLPGPTEYFSGLWTAGRRTADFTQAGKPIPPMPTDV